MQNSSSINPDLLQKVIAFAQHLNCPLTFLDLETTAPFVSSPEFGITEVGVYVVQPWGPSLSFSQLLNPGFPIPPKVTEITGITEQMVSAAPFFPFLAPRMSYLMEKSLVVGFNIRAYDMPGLCTQFHRYGLPLPPQGQILDLRDVWTGLQNTQKGKLTEVAAHYGKPFDGAHRALSDVLGCVHLLEAMLDRHGPEVILESLKKFPSALAPEVPPQPSLEEQEKMEKLARDKEKAKEVILQFVAEGAEWDLPLIVGRGGLRDEFTASLAVQELLDQGQVRPDQIQISEVKDWIAQHWASLCAASPDGRLKPMLAKAKALHAPRELDYTQLRAALKQTELNKLIFAAPAAVS